MGLSLMGLSLMGLSLMGLSSRNLFFRVFAVPLNHTTSTHLVHSAATTRNIALPALPPKLNSR